MWVGFHGAWGLEDGCAVVCAAGIYIHPCLGGEVVVCVMFGASRVRWFGVTICLPVHDHSNED